MVVLGYMVVLEGEREREGGREGGRERDRQTDTHTSRFDLLGG